MTKTEKKAIMLDLIEMIEKLSLTAIDQGYESPNPIELVRATCDYVEKEYSASPEKKVGKLRLVS